MKELVGVSAVVMKELASLSMMWELIWSGRSEYELVDVVAMKEILEVCRYIVARS